MSDETPRKLLMLVQVTRVVEVDLDAMRREASRNADLDAGQEPAAFGIEDVPRYISEGVEHNIVEEVFGVKPRKLIGGMRYATEIEGRGPYIACEWMSIDGAVEYAEGQHPWNDHTDIIAALEAGGEEEQ